MATKLQFEYINEDSIHHSLKCSICGLPFTRPVSTHCRKRHKFCRSCIEPWLQRNTSCPICRQPLKSDDLVSITEDIVIDVLNELAVKCTKCQQTGIQRGDFPEHLETSCPMVVVPCSANDIQCTWIGTRRERYEHLKTCPFQALRPLLFPLIRDNRSLKKKLTQLTEQINGHQTEISRLEEKINEQMLQNAAQQQELVHLKTQIRNHLQHVPSLRNSIIRDRRTSESLSLPWINSSTVTW